MRTHRQLLMWTSVILALSLILFNKLRENPAVAEHPVNQTESDKPKVEFAAMLVESQVFKLQETPLTKQPTEPEPQIDDTPPEPMKPISTSSVVSMRLYSVQKNDNLWEIANDHDIDLYTLLSANKIKNPHLLHQGQKLRIPTQRGVLHKVEKNETLEEVAIQYDITLQSIIDANGIEDPDSVQIGTELFAPSARIPKKLRTHLLPERKKTSTRFIMPAQGRISGGYGYRTHPVLRRRKLHQGIDIVGRYGSPVKAAMAGKVRYSDWMGSYGKLVIIEHDNGFETRYAHNSRLKAKNGDVVRQGQVIALIGKTGRTTGTHLHFEIRVKGKAVNPMRYLR
jgi:murein DD-endopeptidase MepM/ murein hydrolase activator NlpD